MPTHPEGDGGPSLGDLGEAAVLARVFPRLPGGPQTLIGPGDDAAVVAAPDGRVVATTDLMVAGRDFRLDWSTAADVGWKAAAQNLADVAAMGASPTALLVGLVAPPDLPVSWLEGLADGLAAACAGTGAAVVGGDLSSGPVLTVAVTALGDLGGRPAVLRSGARPGDVVAVAGRLGWSAAGLALLLADVSEAGPALVAAHRRPEPEYDAGPRAADAGATAMLDVSDGLLRDTGRIAAASGVIVDLDRAVLAERADELAAEAGPAVLDALAVDPLAWVLTGGEDHALLATFPAAVARAGLPTPYQRIGQVVAAGGRAVTLDGADPSDVVGPVTGWDHFKVD